MTTMHEWSARRRCLYLHMTNTTYKCKRQTSMPSAGFEPAIPATKRPQTYSSQSPGSASHILLSWLITLIVFARKESCAVTAMQAPRRRETTAATQSWPRHYMGWEVSVTPQPRFIPEKDPPLRIAQEAGCVSELVWTQRLEEKSSASVGDRTPVVQSAVKHYTDWTRPASTVFSKKLKSWSCLL
jgi:hypothetical protein